MPDHTTTSAAAYLTERGYTVHSKRGKRVQIYLPADLVEKWEATPRYAHSAAVAEGLRLLWKMPKKGEDRLTASGRS